MSLINQMLKDLQEQETTPSVTPSALRPGGAKRKPAIPTPLILICAGTLVLGATWWMLSYLSKPTPSVELTADPVQTIRSTPTKMDVRAASPQIATTNAEATPAAAAVATKRDQSRSPEPVVAKPGDLPAVAVKIRQEPKIAVAPPPVKSQSAPSALTQPARQKSAIVASAMNPDTLPGAVQNNRQSFHESSRTPLGSSYKLADQAYFDGKLAFEQSKPKQATSSLQQALQLYPGHVPARELLAEIYAREGREQEALALLDEGFKLDADNIGFRKIYSRVLANRGDLNAAITIMMRGGLPSVKHDPDAHQFMATLYHRLGEPYLAAQTYRNLLASWPQNGNYWYGLGDVLEKQGLPDEAMKCYRSALETGDLRKDLRDQARQRLNLPAQGPA